MQSFNMQMTRGKTEKVVLEFNYCMLQFACIMYSTYFTVI